MSAAPDSYFTSAIDLHVSWFLIELLSYFVSQSEAGPFIDGRTSSVYAPKAAPGR